MKIFCFQLSLKGPQASSSSSEFSESEKESYHLYKVFAFLPFEPSAHVVYTGLVTV